MSDVGARRRTAMSPDPDVRPGIHRLLVGIVVALAVGTTAMMALLVARPPSDPAATAQPLVNGTVVASALSAPDADPAQAAELPPGAVEVDLTVRIDDTGVEVRVPRVVDETGSRYQAGTRVRLEPLPGEGEPVYAVADLRREGPLVLLAALFVVAVLAFGRFNGLRALVGLVLSAVVVVAFLVPAILAGRNSMLVALTAALAIAVLTLYLAHGPSPRTTAAVVGTAVTLLLTGVLAWVVLRTADLIGLAPASSRLAVVLPGGISLDGLLLAGVMLGALGVLDDVTMSQASLVFDLAAADPRASRSQLVRRALHLGRGHVIATINTLFLAYAGASLPVLILFATGVDAITTVLTSEVVAVEIARTLVGSLGLIAAVPLTSTLAASLLVRTPSRGAMPALPPITGPLPDLREVEEELWREPVAASDPRLATVPLSGSARRPPAEAGAPRLRAVPESGERTAQPAASTGRVWATSLGGSVERPPEESEPQRVGGPRLRPVEQPAARAEAEVPVVVDLGGAEAERPYQTRRERAAAEREQRSRRKRRAQPEGRDHSGEMLALPPPRRPQETPQPPPAPRDRKRRKTATDAEVEQLEDWFRQLRNPYGTREPEE